MERPPFDLVVVHKERFPFKDASGKERIKATKGDCALHLRYK